jgi:hypothetical protein
MTDEQLSAQGYAAERELELTKDAFEKVQQAIIASMLETSPTNQAKILQLHTAAQILDAVRKALLNTVQTGQIARHALAEAGLLSN